MKQIEKISLAYHPDYPPPIELIQKWKSVGIEVLESKASTKFQLAGGSHFYTLDTVEELATMVATIIGKSLEPYQQLLSYTSLVV